MCSDAGLARREKWRKKRDPDNEAKLLKKFGGLNFHDPDNDFMYTVHTGNMEYKPRHGYLALGVKNGDKEEDLGLPFWLPLLCEMIKDTDRQTEGVEIIKERQEE